MMRKHFNRKGFTLAEVLVVVAILVVLASVGVIALFSHMRNMQKLEMDGQAKEIFVAAQNHLSLAENQGYLGVAEFNDSGLTENFGKIEDPADTEKRIYYIIVNEADTFSSGAGSEVLNQMLPFASIDESARIGGSYIIRYQKKPAQILDVFYVSRSGRYGLKSNFTDDDYTTLKGYLADPTTLKSNLMKYGDDDAIVGYYGGTEAAELKGDPLEPPKIEIVNGDTLYVTITDPNQDTTTGPNGGKNNLQLVVTGKSSKATRVFTLYDGISYKDNPNSDSRISGSNAEYVVLLDSVTGALNDHFCKLSASAGTFQSGENLEIKAVSLNNEVLTNIAESAVLTTNSLFADLNGTTAEIANFRHLLNLDKTYVSDLSDKITVTKAKQTDDWDWSEFPNPDGITPISGTGDGEGKFYPVSVGYKLEYDGGSHRISELNVETTSSGGLFRSLAAESSVHDLELVNFKITAGGDAGALAGSVSGSIGENATISGVLVHNSATAAGDDSAFFIQSSSGNAGGLVGSLNGGWVDVSAAAVYVCGSTNAGGLIGNMTGTVKVTNSYSGGHTLKAKYDNTVPTAESRDDGRFNTISLSGNAGGLIGCISGATKLTLEYCYSTASAYGSTAGGLIGAGGSGDVKYCYATGLVEKSSETGKKGAFVGDPGALNLYAVEDPDDSTKTIPTNYFLESISENASNAGLQLIAATPGDTSYPEFLIQGDARKTAILYDEKLGARYDFPTIQQLNSGLPDKLSALAIAITSVHYGDWQMPTMEILNYTLTNSDTLFTDITFKENTRYVTMVLFGETSKAATAFLLQLSDSQSNATIVDTGVLSTDEREITWRGEPNEGVVQPGFNVDAEKKTLTITFDDITTAKGHFASIFPNLVPGENVTLFAAGGKCSWAELQTLRTKVYPDDMENPGEIIALSDNSLFATPEALEAKEATKSYEPGEGGAASEYVTVLTRSMSAYPAEIKNLRHLQNLDTSVSNVNASADDKTAGKYIKTAKLMESINLTTEQYDTIPAFEADSTEFDWNNKSIKLHDGTAVTSGANFNGIYNKYLAAFDGNDKTIVGLTIDDPKGTSATMAGYAGLFRYVDHDMAIEHLRLANLTVTGGAGKSAGAFAASVADGKKLTLRSVLALGDTASITAAAAGGLVGESSVAGGLVGESSGTLLIANSAASVFVNAHGGTAGGLLGKQTKGAVEIQDSYVGGHTVNGEYTSANTSANISGATAGGLIGATADGTTAIRQSFNAASVSGDAGKAGGIIGVANSKFSSAFTAISVYNDTNAETGAEEGKYPETLAIADTAILNLVYVVAPVNSVGSIAGSAGTYTLTGGNGSVMGNVNADDLTGNGLYFLPDVYSDPLPVQLDDAGHSNIIPIGSASAATLSYAELEAILNAATAASSYERTSEGVDNAILGVAGSHAHLEQETTVFDESLSRFEYPFSIWTTFNFNGSALHYYGDWQRLPHVSNIHLHIHYVASLPKEDGSGRFNKQIDDEEIILQIPYTPTKFNLLYAPDPAEDEDYYDYQLSDSFWSMYQGNWSETTAWPATPVTTFDRGNSGGRETLKSDVFQVINDKSKYVKEDGTAYLNGDTGDPHLHITLVAKYELRQSTLHVLRFFDDKSPTNKVYDTEPTTFLVVTDVSTAASMTLSALLDGKEAELPAFTKSGYRLAGWYDKNGNRIYENYYDHKTDENPTGDEKFHLRLVSGNTEVAKDVLNIDLYAQYRPIQMRTIHIHFTTNDTTDHKVPNVDDWDILYEADRGFYPTIKLPNGNGLSPVSVTDGSGNAISDGSVTLDGAQLTFDIAGVTTTLTDAEKNISYTVTYQVTGTEPAGYVVLCEKQHTGSDGTVYNDSTSYIIPYPYTSADYYLAGTFGATKPGEAPDPYNEAATPIPKEYINDCRISSAEFVPYGMKILSKDDDDNFVDSKGTIVIAADDVSAKKIPDSVNAVPLGGTEEDNYDVTYVVLLQYSRKTYRLIVDTNGCKNLPVYYDPGVEFGRDIYSYLTAKNYYNDSKGYMERDGYSFNGWSYLGGDTGVVETDKPSMPAEDTTVTAQWLGAPAKFTVLFMTQEADDENAYVVSGYDNADELMANAGTGFEFSPSGVLNWLNDRDPTDEIVPGKSTKTYDEGTVVGYLADDDPVKEIFQYFQLNVDKTNQLNVDTNGQPIKVRDDGKTTYRVYFDRKEYTLRFDVGYAEWTGTGASWNYVPWDPNGIYSDCKELYGDVNGQKLRIAQIGGSWRYYQKVRVQYTGDGNRYRAVSDYTGTQYGIVSGSVARVYYSYGQWRLTNSFNGAVYNGTRYKRVEINNSSNDYTLGFVDGEMITLTKVSGNWGYEQYDFTQSFPYTGTQKYMLGHTGGKANYKISSITNARDGGGYDGFLLQQGMQSASATLFNGCNGYDVKVNVNGTDHIYTVYYNDITARFGERIYDEWPSVYPAQNGYHFVGWIQSNISKLYDDQIARSGEPASLKGKYETMAEILLLLKWDGAEYSAKSSDEGIAHEFHCRYSNGEKTYYYHYYFENQSGQYVENPSIEVTAVHGGSGSKPSGQTPSDYEGYYPATIWMRRGSANATAEELTSSNDSYSTYTGGMIMEFHYRLRRWNLVLHNDGWIEKTRIYDDNDESSVSRKRRNGENLSSLLGSLEFGSVSKKTFAGWYTTPGGVEGSEFYIPGAENTSAIMPNGILNLYAVWRDAPSDVKFEETPKYWEGTTAAFISGTGLTLNWPDGKPATEFKSVPNGNTLMQQGIEWDKYKNLTLAGWTFLYWGDSMGNPFSIDQPITAALTLYPYFEKAQATSATLNITYEWGGQGDQPADLDLPDLESVTITFGENFSKTPLIKEGYRVDPPVVPPTFMTDARLREDPFTYDEEKKEYNLVFTYTEDEPEWKYTVGYYLRLAPYGVEGGTPVEIPLLMETDARTARGDFKFEQFYALPESLSGYEFQMLEFWQNDTHKTAYDTTDPTVLLKRGDGNKLKVFLAVDARTVLPESKSTTFNNTVQGFTKDDLTMPYLPTGEGGTITVNNPHCTYYSGVGTDGKPKVESPQNAGLYGVQVVVTVTYEGTEYEFWRSAPVVAGKMPSITYRIDRYTVTLTSGSIIDKFFNNDGNRKATLPADCTLADVGYVARETSNPVITQSGSLVSQSNFTYSFSAESFRRMSSKHGTFDANGNRDSNGTVIRDDFTPNVFSYQVNGLDLNNFSIYKVYGQLYIWDSVDDYNDWKG